MAVSKAQQKATERYVRAHYDNIKFRAPKGKRQELHEHIALTGESLNAFLNRAVDEALERDKSHIDITGNETVESGI